MTLTNENLEKFGSSIPDDMRACALERIIEPLFEEDVNLEDHKNNLDRMFALAVQHAPDDEIDNFTAKKLSPTFLALARALVHVGRHDRIIGFKYIDKNS